jgi:hypothetical protein
MYRAQVTGFVQRLLFGWLLCVAVAVTASAQQPKAVITGPKEARCGALVVLDATASEGVGRLWLLAVAPEETSFLPVESSTKCLFASPVAGRYEFVLIVAGTNANGGPMAEIARHTITLTGGANPPTPPDPPGPTANPYPAPTAEARQTLGAVLAVRMSRADATSLAAFYHQAAKLVESAPAARAAGVKPEAGTTSELRAWLVSNGKDLGLAGRYASLASAVDGYLAGALGTKVRDVTPADVAAIEALAWACWEGGK